MDERFVVHSERGTADDRDAPFVASPSMSEFLGARDRQRLWIDAAHDLRRQSPAHGLACEQGFVLTHDQAHMFGVSDPQVRRLVRRGEWTAPRRGVLSVLAAPSEKHQIRPHGQSPEVAAAALALVRPEIVVSTESAIAMWELPLLFNPGRPCGTMRYGNGGGQADANAHAAALDESEIDCWFGVDVTVPSRSIVDLARNHGVRAGLVAADAALHDGITTEGALQRAVRRAQGWPGVRAARRAIELADARAESPFESLTRLLVIDHGLPVPELQVWVETDQGMVRVDGIWRDRNVVLEVDGLLKYRSTDALLDEKLRQEALERAGYRVVRVMWRDLRTPERTAERIRLALRLGGHPRLLVPSRQIWR